MDINDSPIAALEADVARLKVENADLDMRVRRLEDLLILSVGRSRLAVTIANASTLSALSAAIAEDDVRMAVAEKALDEIRHASTQINELFEELNKAFRNE